jgi:hypothetical protein
MRSPPCLADKDEEFLIAEETQMLDVVELEYPTRRIGDERCGAG